MTRFNGPVPVGPDSGGLPPKSGQIRTQHKIWGQQIETLTLGFLLHTDLEFDRSWIIRGRFCTPSLINGITVMIESICSEVCDLAAHVHQEIRAE